MNYKSFNNFISNNQNFALESLLPFVNNKVKIFVSIDTDAELKHEVVAK